MPSESIAELPEKKAATNFVTAMATLPMIAATMANLDADAALVDTQVSRLPSFQQMSEHRIVVSGFRGHALYHVPVLHYFAVIVEPEDIDPGPIAITRPLLMAMQDDVITFGNH